MKLKFNQILFLRVPIMLLSKSMLTLDEYLSKKKKKKKKKKNVIISGGFFYYMFWKQIHGLNLSFVTIKIKFLSFRSFFINFKLFFL